MNILITDIETSPCVATVWALWKQDISINQILEVGEVICFAAKWYGSKDIIFDSVHQSGRINMLSTIHALMNEADTVVTYNGNAFDVPTLNREFLLSGFTPPSPYKSVDLYRTVKSQFKFVSNKMDFVCQQLGINGKIKHEGHELWLKCLADDDEAWRKMEQYNKHDVEMTEELYDKLLPWIKRHANYSTFSDAHCCPNCGSGNLQRRGLAMTAAMRYQRFQCQNCGAWSRSRMSEFNSKDLLSPIV